MSKTLPTDHIESKMDADSISGTSVSPEVLVVEDISHYSIALSWRTLQEERSSCPIDKWTRFAVDQMNPKTDTYKTIYVGFSTEYIVEDLKPCTTYQFRLRICKANGECLITPTVSAFTCREPRYGKDLHQAVNRNDEEGLLRVLKAGTVDVNVCEKLGLTPLMVAAQKGFTRMVHVLVEHGADIHIKNSSGKDALMLACFAGHLDIVMQLRQLGATWQSQDIAGCSPLHWAVDGGHLPVVTYMIQNGCEVDVRDNVSGGLR
ncbi:hypothetical protein HF521_021322 [Silurus meridionalis]|uniref:Fibronectin type-III domain-containing protein n=1 Tax=Silurus meridionalis TaxID=175797 RepID=A0A8T0BFR3_SILME|nr:hypothetical protein HF521_021322 [Silurus meridionalis]